MKERNGSAVYEALAALIQAGVDLQSVQTRLNQRAALDASRIVSVIPTYNTTTIDAVVTTASGDEELLLVLDKDGKLLAWKWAEHVQPIETTALEFTSDLAAGRLIAARSKMALQLQQELDPGGP